MIEEIVVYNVKEACVEMFPPLLASLQGEIQNQLGFVSWVHSIDIDRPLRRIDRIGWDSLESAKRAHQKFYELDSSGPFLEVIDGKPIVEGHYKSV